MIIDAFTFFNEKELVELRVKYLNEIVDYFVVVEADTTHTGKSKKWNFADILNSSLKEYSHKIQYHQMKVDLAEVKRERENSKKYAGGVWGPSWKIENMQRNFIRNSCSNFSTKDIILISDLDEIPSKEKIEFIKSCDFSVIAPVAFEQSLFHLNCNYLNLERWIGTVATTKELIDKYEPQIFRDNKSRISTFNNAGWSFSSFGGAKKIKEKFEAFAHKEYNDDKFKSIEHIENCQKNGLDLFHRKVETVKVDKNFFPKDLLRLMEENSKFYFG